jgi:quercetin dioxygenase-like cupin family protein
VIANCLIVIALLAAASGSAPLTSVVPATDLVWNQVKKPDGTPLGLSSVDLWGEAKKGAHASLVKFTPGLVEPLHRHSHDLRVVVISGTMRYTIDGVESNDLGSGSVVIIGAEVPHFAHCFATACEVFIEQDGAMDVKPGVK